MQNYLPGKDVGLRLSLTPPVLWVVEAWPGPAGGRGTLLGQSSFPTVLVSGREAVLLGPFCRGGGDGLCNSPPALMLPCEFHLLLRRRQRPREGWGLYKVTQQFLQLDPPIQSSGSSCEEDSWNPLADLRWKGQDPLLSTHVSRLPAGGVNGPSMSSADSKIPLRGRFEKW